MKKDYKIYLKRHGCIMEVLVSCRGTCQSVMSHSASMTMMWTKSPAEGRRSPFLLSRGTCLYPVWKYKMVSISDEKKENMKRSLSSVWTEFSMFNQRAESRELLSLFIYEVWKQRAISGFSSKGRKDLINAANIHSQLLNSPIFKLLSGSVYCPTNSLSDVES